MRDRCAIGRLYLAMTLLVAVAATLLALVPGILLGRVAVGNFLGFLGIQAAGLAAPWWTYLAGARPSPLVTRVLSS